jgi:hypothetical protein
MKIIDLTHTIREDMPVYPGTEKPKLTPTNTYEKDGFKETLLQMYTHTGTHIDPPAHLLKDHATLDQMSPEHFIGSALAIDCRDMKPNESVTIERIFKYGKNALEAEFLLFNFGWDKEYGGLFYFKDVLGMPVEAYEHDMKLWWPHNETIIASLMFYKHTNDQKYLKIFNDVVEYTFEHFADKEYGEWFGYLRRDGLPTEPPCKGHTYKGPFHVLRMLAKCITMLK